MNEVEVVLSRQPLGHPRYDARRSSSIDWKAAAW
jgi:hypothetical protein